MASFKMKGALAPVLAMSLLAGCGGGGTGGETSFKDTSGETTPLTFSFLASIPVQTGMA